MEGGFPDTSLGLKDNFFWNSWHHRQPHWADRLPWMFPFLILPAISS